jgi:hypothetical protein
MVLAMVRRNSSASAPRIHECVKLARRGAERNGEQLNLPTLCLNFVVVINRH